MTRFSRARGAAAAAAIVTAALALAGCSAGSSGDNGDAGSAEDSPTVRFGYIADFNGASLLAIADDQDLWKKHGLEVETPVFTNGPLQIQALGTNDLDFGYIGPGAMWLPASGQAQVASINSLGNADRVIAQPGIDSIEDLKGKKVAVPEGTSGDMILTMALKSAGMSISDVQKVAMDPSTVVAAFSSGQVDAAGIWYPLIDTIEKQVPDLEILAENEDFSDEVAFPSAFVANPTFTKEHPEATKKVLAVLRDAMDYRAENLDDTVKITAAMLKGDADAFASDAKNAKYLSSSELDELTEDGTVATWLTSLNEYFVSAGKLDKPTDASTYYLGDEFVAAGKK
ncbi:aliphatic sulfonate ABC transporter substrate-binding protein [Microbacterium sp. KUDC0406]|uniref:aliphatic sulfonate ABC transporter substrate-binding protein n=1 Tax=Microbacterium sp. KUDC0406 TaxID=2909588 RepID=UPI001F1F13E1|nr:aliphatic sulfonate ABC transporter substrate-binding protein [Microbacterium sp. KUDC0406]UJP09619.1 aliphatic sulfonate ABC transporter substrate-binding protein [Microbacterium sp. KUDC0406]